MPDRLSIALLAAGASRRLGVPKQLVTLDGETLLRRQCRVAIDAAIGPVNVIIGCRADDCAAAIADLPLAVHLNENWTEGMASSIRLAATLAMEQKAEGLLIVHCDQYRVTSGDLKELNAAWQQSECLSACRCLHGEYMGPPVILPARRFESLLQLQGEEGARRVLASCGESGIVNVPIPNAIYDLDFPSQLVDGSILS